jgi:adenine phosphoribosyltransferase
MALPDNGSYRTYADLRRPFVVWNVFAADPLSVRPKQSCFPIAGCVSYRGFFGEADARAHADELSKTGLDVHVSGVAAYSTLGWFDDPLLNTFMHYPETELVRLIVHELSHQIVYVRDDTEFNESFASAVEEEGVRRWLARPGKEGLRAGFERAQKMRTDFAALVLKYRDALDAVYRSGLSDAARLERKSALISELGNEYRALRDQEWNGFRGYDRWFAQDINNATLASIGLYAGAKPAFERLIERSADMPAVWRAMHELARLPRDERRARLDLPPHRDPTRGRSRMTPCPLDLLRSLIRTLPDFPEPGIQFRDITPLLADARGLAQAVAAMEHDIAPGSVDVIAAIEARGFLLAGGLARGLGCGLVPIRKPGKLPGPSVGIDYSLEYGTDRLEMHVGAFAPGARVLVVDDLIATGGTAAACGELVERAGGRLVGFRFLIDLPELGGAAELARRGWQSRAVLTY